MGIETLYLDHDNSVDFILKAKGIALTDNQMDTITQITATVEDTLILTLAANKASGPIKWRQTGYDTGEIKLFFGDQTLTKGTYKVWIVIYDAINTDGIVWGFFQLKILEDIEASA